MNVIYTSIKPICACYINLVKCHLFSFVIFNSHVLLSIRHHMKSRNIEN